MTDESTLPEAVCADCIAFNPEGRQGEVRTGRCRFRPELGAIPEDLPHCAELKVRRDREGKVQVAKLTRVAGAPRGAAPRRDAARPSTARPTLKDPVRGETSGEISMDRNGLRQVLRELLEAETLYGYPEIGRRWDGGTLVLKPADEALQSKEIPIDVFFNKIVMLRDRLRVLEAKINSNDALSGAEKIELQGYISKCYGTLTTFNVLFADKTDHFSSK
jgi:hypothetical protein